MKRFFFPILMSAMLVYGGKVSAQTDKDHVKSVKPLPAGHKPAVAPVTVKPLPPAPTAAKPSPVQRPAAAPAPITAKPIPVAPRPLPSAVKPVPVVAKPVPVAPKPVAKTKAPAHVTPAATKSKSKKAVAGKAAKKSKKPVEIVTNEPVYTPAPAYREPEKLNVEQRHEGPTTVEIKDQKIKVNNETVARLNSINDCINITIDHKSELRLVPEKKEECVKKSCCRNGKLTRYCYMKDHCKRPPSPDCKRECKPSGPRPTRPCRYNY